MQNNTSVLLEKNTLSQVSSIFTQTNNTLSKYSSGILFISFFALFSFYVSDTKIFGLGISMSPLIIGIVVGMMYGNIMGNSIPKEWSDGITFSAKKILRLGIVLYGFRLTFQQLSVVGMEGVAVAGIMLSTTMALGVYLGIKVFKMDRSTTILTSAGSSVCGAAAVLATEGAIKSQAYKAGIAVATVVVFGTIALFTYPILFKSGFLNMTDTQFGVFVGATVHEVAQVVAIGGAFDNSVSDPAVITKMLRVMMLTPLLLAISIAISVYDKKYSKNKAKGGTKIMIPWFAVGFLAIAGINSMGIIEQNALDKINIFDTFLLTMSMTALGMTTKFNKIKEAGAKPFYLGTIMFAWLVVGGYFITKAII